MLLASDFGDQIRARRIALGKTQADLAKILGLSDSTVSVYESGKKVKGLNDYLRTLDALGVDVELRERSTGQTWRIGGRVSEAMMSLANCIETNEERGQAIAGVEMLRDTIMRQRLLSEADRRKIIRPARRRGDGRPRHQQRRAGAS